MPPDRAATAYAAASCTDTSSPNMLEDLVDAFDNAISWHDAVDQCGQLDLADWFSDTIKGSYC